MIVEIAIAIEIAIENDAIGEQFDNDPDPDPDFDFDFDFDFDLGVASIVRPASHSKLDVSAKIFQPRGSWYAIPS